MTQKPIVVTCATVELTLDDGQTWRYDLDTTEPGQPIELDLEAANDFARIVTDENNLLTHKPGNRRTVNITLSGRGPIPVPTTQEDPTPWP